MKIDIRATNLDLSDEVRAQGEQRIRFALGRFTLRLRSVSVVLTDVNGPRGGVDTSCRIRVVGIDGFEVQVTELERDPARAISCALRRTTRTVARIVARTRDPMPVRRHLRRAS